MDPDSPVLYDDRILYWMHLTDSSRIDWQAGALLAIAGLVGALLTLYVTSPGKLPAIGGNADTDDLSLELRALRRAVAASLERRRLSTSTSSSSNEAKTEAEMFHDDHKYMEFIAARFDRSQRSLMRRTVPIFLILGPVASVTFGLTLAQGFIFGTVGPAAVAALSAQRFAVDAQNNARNSITDLATVSAADIIAFQKQALSSEQELKEFRESSELAMEKLRSRLLE